MILIYLYIILFIKQIYLDNAKHVFVLVLSYQLLDYCVPVHINHEIIEIKIK